MKNVNNFMSCTCTVDESPRNIFFKMEENHVNLEKIQYKAFKFKITTTVLVFEVRKPYQRNNKRCAHHSLIRIVIEKQNFAENVITLPQN